MTRRNDFKTVESIILSINKGDQQISYEKLSKQTKIRTNSLKKWLRIMELIQNSSVSISLTENGLSKQSSSAKLAKIRTQVKKREEDPNIKEFLTEFRGVLTKTKLSLEDEKTRNYPQLEAPSGFPSALSPEYTELQSELTQVLQQGLSYLSSSEQIVGGGNSKSEIGFIKELKQAVNLGIENLEKVVITDYKEKKGRVTAMKSELELAFEARENRMKDGGKT